MKGKECTTYESPVMKIALVQAALAWGNVEENLKNFDDKIARCTGCDLIILPEMFTSGCMMVKKEEEIARAEKIKTASFYGKVRQEMLRWAVCQKALVLGSTVYGEGGRYYNRLIAVTPEGNCYFYDKRHCFRMGGENEHFTAGNRQLIFQFKGIRIAAFICYDLRFPVWSRNRKEYYDLAVYIANWPESRREVWQTLLKARAIENQAYVAGVNCVGTDEAGLTYAGDSALIDARGKVVGGCREFTEETVIVEMDAEELHRFRKKFSVLEDADDFQLFF